MILGFVFFSLGTFIFCMSLHNIDLAWNMSESPYCLDTNSFGNIQDKHQMYINGFTNMITSYFFLFSSAIMFLYVNINRKI